MDHLQGSSVDPWLQYDPWMKDTAASQHRPPATAAAAAGANPGISQAQLASLESSLEKKIMSELSKYSDQDVQMEAAAMDPRITQLEQQFQQVQCAQVSTDSKLQQLQTQIDQQSKLLGDKIDEKLDVQMERIESLLCSKRVRHE